MKLGVMTVLLGDLTLEDTLKYLKSLGVQAVEIGCGGTPGTAHAHIKRIYAKTGLHSRQEILDYMQQYTS